MSPSPTNNRRRKKGQPLRPEWISKPTPPAEPAGDILFLKPKGGDVFRRVREDGSEAEEFKFQRDASGKVTGFMHFSNPTFRLADEANVRQ